MGELDPGHGERISLAADDGEEGGAEPPATGKRGAGRRRWEEGVAEPLATGKRALVADEVRLRPPAQSSLALKKLV
jgi:hypothetical protein